MGLGEGLMGEGAMGAPPAAPSAAIRRARPVGLGRCAARLWRPSGAAGATTMMPQGVIANVRPDEPLTQL